jgi:tetratricopeptide (TPR) repeat protein
VKPLAQKKMFPIRVRRFLVTGSTTIALLLPAAHAFAISMQDVVTLVGLDIPDEQIIKKIQKDSTPFNLKPSDIVDLKKKGVSEKVIRAMLQNGKAEVPATTAAGKAKEKEKRELSAAEQAAEEAQIKEESVRLAEEERKRQDAVRKAFASKVLSQGQSYANSGEFVKAIQVFNKFIDEGPGGVPYPPDSNEVYVAKYGIANALARAGLMQSAANLLLEVVRAGSDKMFFVPAFEQLRDLRRKINYRPPELEDLTKFSVASADESFQSSFNYFVGEFLHDFGLSADAKPYLEKVANKSDDFGRAQYLLGLIAFEDESMSKADMVKAASQAFQQAVVAGESQGAAGQPVVDLAYLALARLAYEFEQFDAAIYYYKKISKNSPKLANAFYEAGWTYFLKNDTSRALGTFHALHSPFFAHQFYPELWVLEATTFVNLCQAEHAEAAMNMFASEVLVLSPPLRDFLKKNKRPEDFYASFLESVNKKTSASLPRQLQSPVLSNVEFFNLYKTIQQIDKEEGMIKANLTPLGAFGQDLLARLGQLKNERISEAGVVIQKTLRQTEKDIGTYQDKLDQLRIDLDDIKLQVIDAKIKGDSVTQTAGVATQGNLAIAGSDSMVWPFEGEFWKDEIGAYRAFVKEQCSAMNR